MTNPKRNRNIMGDRFTDLQMLKLVKSYRDHPCLWNFTSDLYKNRTARENAYKEILAKLNIAGLSMKEIPKKIKNMRSSYYQELKRIKKRSGADPDYEYKPKLSWFATADEFLRMFRKQKETISNIDETSNTTSDNDSETQKIEDDYSNTADHRNNTEDNNNENDDSPSGFTVPSMKPLRKKNKKKKDDINVAIDRIDKIAKNVTNLSNSFIEHKKNEDEYDIFGKYIAMTVRSLPGELAIIAKTDIQKALSDVQMKALTQGDEDGPLLYPTCYFSSASESSLSNNHDEDLN